MKKMKLLTPILGVVALGSTIAPIATSCANQATETNVIPTEYLNIVGYRLKGFKNDVDLSKYDTLVIPDTVKYINDEAFADAFVPGTKGGFIRKIVFPNTIKSIGKSAFKNCSVITTLDFSTWDINQIRYCNIAADDGYQAFEGWSDNGNLITNSDITKESKEELEDRLNNAGLHPTWFAEESTDKITPDSSWMSQNTEKGLASFQFQLNQDLPADAENYLYGSVIWKNGTRGVSVYTTNCEIKGKDVTDNKFSLPVSLINHERIGDYAEFDIAIGLMSNKTGEEEDWKPIWKQTVSGFKLNLINNLATSVKVTAEQSTVKTEETLQLTATVSPEDATNKEVTWKSSDEKIAKVDANGLVTGVAKGTATITCTALGGLNVQDSFTVTVEQGAYELKIYEFYGLPEGYTIGFDEKTMEPTTISIEKDQINTYKIKLAKGSDGKLVAPNSFGIMSYSYNASNESYIPLNEDSIVVKCNGETLKKGVDWEYDLTEYSSDQYAIVFKEDYKWNIDDELEISASCKQSLTKALPVLTHPIETHFPFVNIDKDTGIMPIETAIAGGDSGLYGVSPVVLEPYTFKANWHFNLSVSFDVWTHDYGKPVDGTTWDGSEISIIYDFDDLSTIDLNTIKIYTLNSPQLLTLNTDYTLTQLSTNRIKITFNNQSENFPANDDGILLYGFADKETTLVDAFMMADTNPSATTWSTTAVQDESWTYECSITPGTLASKSSTTITGLQYSCEETQPINATLTVYDFAGKLAEVEVQLSSGQAELSDITLSRAPQSKVVIFYKETA